jgi:hypothetical protein
VGKNSNTDKKWTMFELSHGIPYNDSCVYLGAISRNGTASFAINCLPPEMFALLSPTEERVYHRYWSFVKKHYKVDIDERLITPYIDSQTGEVYVIKCFFDTTGIVATDHVELPVLPYELVRARENIDVWNLGQLLYYLLAGIHLFPENARNDAVLDYKSVCKWDHDALSKAVYNHVQDSLAQDILFRLLSSYHEREVMTLDSIVSHPYTYEDEMTTTMLYPIVDKRKAAATLYFRKLEKQRREDWEKEFFEKITTTVYTLDLSLLERMHFSPTEIVSSLSVKYKNPTLPCSFVVLPYKLIHNKSGQQTPSSKEDIELAQQLGIAFLELSKACRVAAAIHKVVVAKGDSPETTLSCSAFLHKTSLSEEILETAEHDVTRLASQHIEAFRENPMSVAVRYVEEKIMALFALYENNMTFLYFVDEYTCTPVINEYSPVHISDDRKGGVLRRGLVFAHLCSLYARGATNSVCGLVRLIFEAAYPYIPPSWNNSYAGLVHVLDDDVFRNEAEMLLLALGQLGAPSYDLSKHVCTDDYILYMNEFLLETDPHRHLGGLRRVVTSEGGCMWMTKENTEILEVDCRPSVIKATIKRQREQETKMQLYEEMFSQYMEEKEAQQSTKG